MEMCLIFFGCFFEWNLVLLLTMYFNRLQTAIGKHLLSPSSITCNKWSVMLLKNFTGCERREMWNSFCFEVLHVAWPEPQWKRSVMGVRSSPINTINVEIMPVSASYITQKKKLPYNQHLVSACFVSTFDLRFEPADVCFYLRYLVSYT